MEDNKIISVRNRNNGDTGYIIPDMGINRTWAPEEVKKVPFGELKAFSYMSGGLYALNNLFIVEDEDAIKELNMQVEPEYYYTEKEIRDILFNSSYDQFADFLDFAPDGALEIAKNIAVKEEIPDVKKRDMLSERTGLNITSAILVNKVMNEDTEKKEEKPKERRVKIETSSQKPARRTEVPSAPKYNIITTKK